MLISPSELQRRASDPSSSAWVAASAGSGKTKVLTDRVLRLLLAEASPSRILCITYTKAAAAEMQNRLHKRLGEWVVMEEGKLRQTLEELTGHPPHEEAVRNARRLFALLLEDAPGLRIQTFHSFCQSLLARFPLEAGVAPHFTLIEEQDARDLLEEARQRLLQTALMRTDKRLSESVEELIAELGEKGFGDILEDIVARRREVEHILAMRGLAVAHNTRVYEALGLPYYGIGKEALLHEALPMDEAGRQRVTLLADVLSGGSKQDKALEEKLRVFVASGDREDLMLALLTQEGKARAASKLMTKGVKEKYPEHFDFALRLAEACEQAHGRLAALGVARFSDAVAIVAESLFALYAAMKRARGCLDYDDLILKTRALLRGEGMAKWVLYKIDGGIDHLLIDEAQDTSPEQWELKEVLEDEFFAGKGASDTARTLFVVGDGKQSIYRFQGADPEGFKSQKERTRALTAECGEPFEDVPMHTSFRSAPAILAAVDAVFPDGEGHIPHRAHAAGRVELWPLARWARTEDEEEPWPVPDRNRDSASPEMQLALRIAGTIAGNVGQGVWRAGDILVLVRSRGDFIHYLSRALKDRGVLVAGLDRMKFTEHLAVRDLMALAQFLLLPEDDYTLACLLKSPLYNLSEETLFALCHGRESVSLWERLRTDDACSKVRAELEELLSRADWGSPHALFCELLYARGGRQRFMARMGEEVEEVLEVFMSLALDFERTQPPTLQGFLVWLAHGAGEIKRDMEQGVDAVRIMTVHGAKGLEAPVVFLADKTWRQALRDQMYFLPCDGGKIMLCSPRADADDAVVAGLRGERRREEAEESKRLLYVAMTRARDELYVTGWQSGERGVPEDCWHRRVELALRGMEGVETTGEDGLLLAQSGMPEAPEAVPGAWCAEPLPEFAHTPPGMEAPQEPLLAPSHLDEAVEEEKRSAPGAGGSHAARGLLVHRLLQLLGGVEDALREQVATGYLSRHVAQMPQTERVGLINEVLGVMRHPDVAAVFAPGALAEAPVIGTVNGQRIAGQIDRLVVGEAEVLIVDFKTGSVPEDNKIPESYRRQMRAYGALLGRMYPEHAIRLALLYTSGPKIVFVA